MMDAPTRRAREYAEEEKTPYFPAVTKPIRLGLYECKCCHALMRWDGSRFHDWEDGDRLVARDFMWRGLISNVKFRGGGVQAVEEQAKAAVPPSAGTQG